MPPRRNPPSGKDGAGVRPARSFDSDRAAPDEPTRIAPGGVLGTADDDSGADVTHQGAFKRPVASGQPGKPAPAKLAKPSKRSRGESGPIFADGADSDDLAPFSASRANPLYQGGGQAPDREVMELLTSDIDLSDLTDEHAIPDFGGGATIVGGIPQPDEYDRPRGFPASPSTHILNRPLGKGGRSIGALSAFVGEARSQPVPAVQISRRPVNRDFDEDLATRVKDASMRDPSLELSLSDALVDSRPGWKLDQGLPPLDSEKSVVRRIVKSVVAHLPRAVKSAANKSGIFKLPGVSDGMSLETRDARALGLDPRAWREARTSPIFDGLPNDAIKEALTEKRIRILRMDRDTIIPVGGGLVLVRSGQVALGQFPADKLEIEREISEKLLAANPLIGKKLDKKERRRRSKAGALIRMAEKNLATFEEGDVVEISVGAKRHDTLGIYAVTPVTVLVIERDLAEGWRSEFPFMADRLRRAGASARARVEATAGAKAVVADFFIRHGLSVSMTLRVRKLDACIECGACEKACEDRYGGKRLSLNGRILGNLDFVDACHTCTDQRCIDPCNFDAISFDPQRQEVLINEANCTGCTLCAVNCPYDAIEMYELDDKPKLKLRLEKAKALDFGDGAGRKAKLRRIASKCDHCAFYEDQACISACPTGALIEILPSDVVSQMPEQARATARAGFDRTVRVDVNQLNQIDTFNRKGLSQLPELGRARAHRGRLSMTFWWFVGGLVFLGTCAEIALRIYRPALSLSYLIYTRAEGFDPELALSRVDFRPGCELAVNLGYVGTALMITGMAYVWRRRMPFMRTVGSLRAWFDWHVLSGVFGPLFILLHTAAKLDNWVSLAFWSMVVTVLSGLLGRYLTTQLPQIASVAAVETLEVDRQLGKLRIEHPGVRVADNWFEGARRRLATFEQRFLVPSVRNQPRQPREATVGDGVYAIGWLIRDDLTRFIRHGKLARLLRSSVRGKGSRKIRSRTYKLATPPRAPRAPPRAAAAPRAALLALEGHPRADGDRAHYHRDDPHLLVAALELVARPFRHRFGKHTASDR